MADKHRDPFVDHYRALIGRTITQLVRAPASPGMDTVYGLEFDNGTIAWIQQDPEGNGPGFLEIQTAEQK